MTLGRLAKTLALVALACLSLGARPHHRAKPKAKARAKARPRVGKVQKPEIPPAAVPLQNPQALAPFFRALGAHPLERSVRVLHFGDSHSAADYWTGRMRQRLQARFGDGGPGLILPGRPWRGYHHEGVNLQEGLHWPADSLRAKTCDGWVGLTGASIHAPAEGGVFTLQAAYEEARIQVLGPDKPTVLGQVPEPLQTQALGERQFQVYRVPGHGLETLALQLSPGSTLLGVELRSGKPGLIYDELGLNGAELLDLERWQPTLRKSLLAQAKPDLIVLAYGTNDMGRTDISPEEYQARARRLMRDLKQESGACVLVVGPLDRIGRQRRQVPRLREGARWVTKALRSAALASDCAFWDARQAMGGEGALLKWKRKGLAQPDLVHLTGPGYEKLGDMMVEALLKELPER